MDLSSTPALAIYVEKLINSRKRMNAVNDMLTKIMERLAYMQENMEINPN